MWKNYRTGSNYEWEVEGALGTLDRETPPVGKMEPTATGLYTFSLNPAIVQSWLDTPTNNHGILIGNAANPYRAVFDCRDTTTASNLPKLTVYYSQN